MKIRAPLLDGPSYGPLSPHGGSYMKSGFVEFWSPRIMGHDRYVLFFYLCALRLFCLYRGVVRSPLPCIAMPIYVYIGQHTRHDSISRLISVEQRCFDH